jgi:hypothetical protein
MNITLLDLALGLVAHDTERTCPFCSKTDWGAEQHDAGCPFDLAYRAIRSTEYEVRSKDQGPGTRG